MRRIQRTILARISLLLVFCCSHALAAEEALTREDVLDLLKERDAAIIELQHAVKALTMRLDANEHTTDPADLAETTIPQLNGGELPKTEPQQGFARLDVDEQAAQRALERTLVQGGALLLPAWRMQFSPSSTSSLNESEFPVLVTSGTEILLGTNEVKRTAFTTNLALQVGLPFDSQFELGIPYKWVKEKSKIRVQGAPFGQTSKRSGNGIGSLKLGLAKTLARERGWRPNLIGRITWDTGSGDQTDNGIFIGGFESIGGSLTFTKRKDPLVFFGSASYQTFVEDQGIEPGNQFAFSLGTAMAVSPSSSLFASISNQFLSETEVGNQQIDGTDLTSVVLSLGASTIVSRGLLLSLTTGIGISDNAPDYSIGLSASFQTDVLRKSN